VRVWKVCENSRVQCSIEYGYVKVWILMEIVVSISLNRLQVQVNQQISLSTWSSWFSNDTKWMWNIKYYFQWWEKLESMFSIVGFLTHKILGNLLNHKLRYNGFFFKLKYLLILGGVLYNLTILKSFFGDYELV